MLTPFGKLVRKLRIDKGESLKDMAADLDLKPAYLSAVETGRKNPSTRLVESVVARFCLTHEDKAELEEAAQLSRDSVKINMEDFCLQKRQIASSFARNFDSLSQDEMNQLSKLLNKQT